MRGRSSSMRSTVVVLSFGVVGTLGAVGGWTTAARAEAAQGPEPSPLESPKLESPKPESPRARRDAARASFEFLSSVRAARKVERGELQVLDTRTAAKYLAGHATGAISLRDEQLREARGGLPTAMLDAGELAALFGRIGIDPARPVLVYSDGEDPLAATLTAYALLKAGHRDVSVLDGGYAAWSGPTSQEYPPNTPRSWAGVTPGEAPATLADAVKASTSGETPLIDARPAKFFRGETRAWKRNGHIPGAVSFDWHQVVAADNESLVKPAAEIGELLTKAGLSKHDAAIVYCGTGREATLLYLYLKHVAGWSRARLFEGSWTQWQSNPELAVATGAEERTTLWSDGEVTISGQPSADVVRELADRGAKVIVNCRTPGEVARVTFGERPLIESLGMTYVEIPLGGSDGYEPEDIETLKKVVDEHGTAGLHLHCAVGSRAATLWGAYLVKHRGVSPAEAVERLRTSGALRETSLERLLAEELLPARP